MEKNATKGLAFSALVCIIVAAAYPDDWAVVFVTGSLVAVVNVLLLGKKLEQLWLLTAALVVTMLVQSMTMAIVASSLVVAAPFLELGLLLAGQKTLTWEKVVILFRTI